MFMRRTQTAVAVLQGVGRRERRPPSFRSPTYSEYCAPQTHANEGGSDPPRRYGTCSPPRGEQEMISKREREPSSSFEGSEEDQRERRRAFDIELILGGTNSDHSGDRSPPESVTTREITKLEILVVAAERSSVLVLARARCSLSLSVGLFVSHPPTLGSWCLPPVTPLA